MLCDFSVVFQWIQSMTQWQLFTMTLIYLAVSFDTVYTFNPFAPDLELRPPASYLLTSTLQPDVLGLSRGSLCSNQMGHLTPSSG